MHEVDERYLVRHDSGDHDSVSGPKGFVKCVMRFCLPGRMVDDGAPPIVARRTDNHRAPVDLFDFGVVAIGDLGSVPHDTQPRGRHKHYAISGVAVKTENDLTVLLAFCGAQTNTVEPQCNSDFLHITSILL